MLLQSKIIWEFVAEDRNAEVKTLHSVSCPKCKAPSGAYCRTRTGKTSKDMHIERVVNMNYRGSQ